MSEGVWVLLVALAGAGAFGLWRAARDGRFRPVDAAVDAVAQEAAGEAASGPTHPPAAAQSVLPADHELGSRATLLQFSSAFCAPCRATRRILTDVAAVVPGVRHIEVDAEQHLDLVRRLGVLRTPTTLILGPGGEEVTRATGAPRKQDVIAGLGRVIE